jgi:hypothetical protein
MLAPSVIGQVLCAAAYDWFGSDKEPREDGVKHATAFPVLDLSEAEGCRSR